MCSTRLICRLPARDSRWRTWSPEEASIGAVPFQEAKCARVGNRVMSRVSISSRAAPDGPIPCRLVSVVPVAASSAVKFLVGGLGALVDALGVADQLSCYLPARLACRIARADLGEQRLGLGRGQALLGAPRG
jgi:hypothetical protein